MACGIRVGGGRARSVECHTFGQRQSQQRVEAQLGAGERGGADVDHQRFTRGGKSEGNRVGTQRCARAAGRRDQARRPHRVQTDQIGACDALDVAGAAPAHPAVGHADECKTMFPCLGNRRVSRVMHGEHAGLIAAVEQCRHWRLVQRAHRRDWLLLLRAVGDLQNLRQARVFVAAQCSVEHVIGEDRCVRFVVADAEEGAHRQGACFGHRQTHALAGWRCACVRGGRQRRAPLRQQSRRNGVTDRDRQRQNQRPVRLAVRVQRQRTRDAAAERIFQHEIERIDVGHFETRDRAAHEIAEMRAHPLDRDLLDQ